jgi:hypothetical protein
MIPLARSGEPVGMAVGATIDQPAGGASRLTSGPPSREPRVRKVWSRAVPTLALVAMLLGGLSAPASPQSACGGENNWPACEGGEGRAIGPGSAPPRNPEAVSPDASARPRLRPWGAWPDPAAAWPREGWAVEGTTFIGPDGRTCWPHGDHFHCR